MSAQVTNIDPISHTSRLLSSHKQSWLLVLINGLPLAFTFVAFAQLSLVEGARLIPARFIAPATLAACVLAAMWLLQRRLPCHDRTLLPLITLLIGWGLDDDNAHSPNEKLSLADFHRAIRASARLWRELSTVQPQGR